jgi:hypothetical protein
MWEWRFSSVTFTLALNGDQWSASRPGRFTPEKQHLCSLDMRLGDLISKSGRYGEKKNLFLMSKIEPQPFSRQPIATRLSYPDFSFRDLLLGKILTLLPSERSSEMRNYRTYGICGKQSAVEAGFLRVLRFHLPKTVHSTNFSIIGITRGS